MRRAQVGGGRFPALLLIAMSLLLLLPACGKKKPTSPYESGRGVGEGTLGGSSLDQFRRGSLGAGEEGPLRDVHFGYDSFELSNEARETLRANSDWLRDNPSTKVEVEGHCDNRGTVEYNLALGARRAKSVRDYVVSLGVPGDRITTISYGEELPLCHEDNEGCWAENRRSHFVVLNQ